MKKLLFLCLLLAHTLSTFGQEKELLIGLEIAPALRSLQGNSVLGDYGTGIGFAAGISTEYFFNTSFSLRSGLFFERKGSNTNANALHFTDVNGEPLGDLDLNFDYLTVPLLGTFSSSGRNRFYVGVGPYLAWLVSQKYKIEDTTFEYFPGIEGDSDYVKRLDAGVAAAIGMSLPIGDHLLLDIGPYSRIGLLNISNLSSLYGDEVMNRSLGMTFGLRFR